MSKLYSIQESTLTDIGDALRRYNGETRPEIINAPYLVTKSPNATGLHTVNGSWGSIAMKVDVCKIPGASRIELTYSNTIVQSGNEWVLCSPGEYTTVSSFPRDTAYALESTGDGITRYFTVEGDTFTICVYKGYTPYGYYIQYIGYDADGNPIEVEGCSYIEQEIEVPNTYSSADVAKGVNDTYNKGIIPFHQKITNTLVNVPESALEGLTELMEYGFYWNTNLESIELPDSITRINQQCFNHCSKLANVKMPHNGNLTMENAAFGDCQSLKSVTLYENPPTVKDTTFSISYLKNIYVPGSSLDLYKTSGHFGKTYLNLLTPNSPYADKISGSKVLLYGEIKNYSVELLCCDEPPVNYLVSTLTGEYIDVTDMSATNTSINFNLSPIGTKEGQETIIVTCELADGSSYTRELIITVYETAPETTYTIEDVEGASYGFALNDAGYYESQNKGKNNSAALCKVNISNFTGKTLYIDLINYAENNYDYGLFSQVDKTLAVNNTDDGTDNSTLVKYSFKIKSSADVVTISYDDAIGSCFIYVKFRKDGSGNKNNDSLQFKIRFE